MENRTANFYGLYNTQTYQITITRTTEAKEKKNTTTHFDTHVKYELTHIKCTHTHTYIYRVYMICNCNLNRLNFDFGAHLTVIL